MGRRRRRRRSLRKTGRRSMRSTERRLRRAARDKGPRGVARTFMPTNSELFCALPMGTTSKQSATLPVRRVSQSDGENMCKELVRLAGPALFLLMLAMMPAEAGAFRLIWTQEATIADILAAFKAKELTCRQLVQM